jgi:hypothetical protein
MFEKLHRRWMAAGIIVLSAAAAGCFDFIGPGEALEYPDGIEFFDEALFPPIWAELKACSHLSGDLRKVDFYYVPRATLPPVDQGVRTLGMYFPKSNRIFVVESEKANRDVIRHEMMHALLGKLPGHPPQYFSEQGVCGYV